MDDFLVTITSAGRTRRLVWRSDEPMFIDHPGTWLIERTADGVLVKDTTVEETDESGQVLLTEESIERSDLVKLPGDEVPGGRKGMMVKLTALKPIRPAYMPLVGANAQKLGLRPSQLVFYQGAKQQLLAYRRIGNSQRGYVENKPIFNLHRVNEDLFEISPLIQGVTFREEGGREKKLMEGAPVRFSESELAAGSVCFETHWWRVNRIAVPEPLPMLVVEEDYVVQERAILRKLVKALIGSFLLCWLGAYVSSKISRTEKPPAPVKVELKQPKLVAPRPEPVKPPEPPKPKPKPEPPKPKQKAEPPAKKPPKVQPAPKPKVQPPPPPPQKVAPPPPTPTPPKPVTPPPPTAQQIQAAQQKELSKSLDFLSPSANKPVGTVALDKANNKASSKYSNVNAGPVDKKASVLNKMANNTVTNGSIETKNSRNIDGRVALEGSSSKTLNNVQGKVSLNSLYADGGTADVGSSLSSKGITMSGDGQMPEGLLVKTLSKYIQKFQYCYEKALLSDASLAGNVMMQWTIETSGAATGVRVVRTQINNAGFQSCMAKELSKIRFPAPKGGSVIVKYPFSFSSSSL